MRARSGFTLVELLISAVLLALVSAGVATVMSTCLGAWRAGQARADLAQQAEAVLDTVGRDLRASFIGRRGFFVSGDEGDGQWYLELTTLSRRMMRLLYLAERGETPGENMSDLAQVVYYAEPAGDGATFALYREEICPPGREPLAEEARDPEKAQLLCDGVASFRLRFWDGQDQADWLSEWDSLAAGDSGGGSVPAAVEIALVLRQDGREQTCVTRVPVCLGESAPGGAQ